MNERKVSAWSWRLRGIFFVDDRPSFLNSHINDSFHDDDSSTYSSTRDRIPGFIMYIT